MKNDLKELKSMDIQSLRARLEDLRSEALKLRLSVVTSPSKSFASTKNKLKKSIARVLTLLQQRI
jgi:ribosomal protein L29